MMLSIAIFSYYPLKFLNLVSIAIFIFTLIACTLVNLAFNKKILIGSVAIFLLMAFEPYPLAFLSHYTGVNLFETLPIEVVDFLNINVYNLTETANKLFILIAPSCATIIVFLILSSIATRIFLTSLFNKLQKAL